MTDNPHDQLQAAQADAEAALRRFLRPYLRRSKKLGFRTFFKVEPEVVIANGTQIHVRAVTIRLVPESPRAKSFCVGQNAQAIEATDRYADLIDAQDCIAGAFEAALETAGQA